MYYRKLSRKVYKCLQEIDMHMYLVEAYLGMHKSWTPERNQPEYFITVVLNQHVPKEVKIRISKFLLEEAQSGHLNLYGNHVEAVKVRRNFYHEPSTYQGKENEDDY